MPISKNVGDGSGFWNRAEAMVLLALSEYAASVAGPGRTARKLFVEDAAQGFALASASLDTAGKRVAAAQAGFRITARKRDLGQVNQTEFLDARRALTDAELNQNRTRFEALGALAEIEYAGGGSTRTAEGTHP